MIPRPPHRAVERCTASVPCSSLLRAAPCLVVLLQAALPGVLLAGPDVTHYALEVALDPATLELDATAFVNVKAAPGGGAVSRIDLDLTGFTISALTWNGGTVSYVRTGDVLSITLANPLAEGKSGQLAVHYQGIPQPYVTEQGDLGVMQDRDITFAINVTDGAHYWFPCRDRLDDKASVDLSLVLPHNYVSTGPGHLESITNLDGRFQKHQWRMAQEVTPYLISFAVSNRYEERHFTLDLATGPLEADVTLLPETWPSATTALEPLPGMLNFMEARYGRFPYDRLGMHEIPFPGNVEQPGNISMGSLYWTGVTDFSPYFAHELAHTWFQGLVTIRTWNDIYMSESVAAWHEILWTEQSDGIDAADALAATYLAAYRVGIAEEGSFPLSSPEVLFGYTVYMKGPVTFRLLEHLLGRETLAGLLRSYLEDPDGVSDLNTFLELIEATGEPDVAMFRDEWIDRAGLPDYQFGWSTAASADGVGVALRLKQSSRDPLYTTPIDVRLEFADGSTRIVTMRPGSNDQTDLLCLDQAPTNAVLNPRGMVPGVIEAEALTVSATAAGEACVASTPGDDGDGTGCGAREHGSSAPILGRQGAAAVPLLALVGLARLVRRRREDRR